MDFVSVERGPGFPVPVIPIFNVEPVCGEVPVPVATVGVRVRRIEVFPHTWPTGKRVVCDIVGETTTVVGSNVATVATVGRFWGYTVGTTADTLPASSRRDFAKTRRCLVSRSGVAPVRGGHFYRLSSHSGQVTYK